MAAAKPSSTVDVASSPSTPAFAPFHVASVSHAGDAMPDGTASATSRVQACLDQIDTHDSTLHSYITVAPECALAEAGKVDDEIVAGRRRSPLHGIPFAVKDTYDAAGLPTTAASRLRLAQVASEDCALVARLKSAGAILLGKLTTWEYGTGNGGEYFDLPFPPARNPWDLQRFSGGSSSGAGVAVAAGTAAFALGSDTTGSVRLPAAATGTVGLMPTPGLLDLDGVLPNTFSLDVAGPITWTVEECALLMDTLLGGEADATDSFRATLNHSVQGLRVAVVGSSGPGFPDADEPLAAAFQEGLEVLRGLGILLDDIDLPVAAADCFAVTQIIGPAETAALHQQELRDTPSSLGRALRDKLLAGSAVRAVDYITAQRQRTLIAQAMSELMSRYDALITFGALHMPPVLGVEPDMTRFTIETMLTPFNLSGQPALVQCNGFAPNGMPTHWQIVANRHDEAMLLRLAHAYESATAWRDRRPAMNTDATARSDLPHERTGDRETRQAASSNALLAHAQRVGLDALSEVDLARLELLKDRQEEVGAALPCRSKKNLRPYFGWASSGLT